MARKKPTKAENLQAQKAHIDRYLALGYLLAEYGSLKVVTSSADRKMIVWEGVKPYAVMVKEFDSAEELFEEVRSLEESEKKKAQDRKARQTAVGYNAPVATVSKAIKAELKKLFPETKFSVRSDSYTGGNAVDISWDNGPSRVTIEAIVKKYQYGAVTRMDDCYENTNVSDTLPQAKFVSCSRNIAQEVRDRLAEQLEKMELPVRREDIIHPVLFRTELPSSLEGVGLKLVLDASLPGSLREQFRVEVQRPVAR